MKAFGSTETSGPVVPLTDVALALSPESMREFARFVAYAAAEMERLGAAYDHVHFKDFSDAWQKTWPDVQLTKIHG